MLKNQIYNFIGCDASYDEASVVIFGAPFDSTTSYRPGSRFAPAAIRNESYGIETYSPYQEKDLEDYAVFDAGDIELPFGDTVAVLDMIKAQSTKILGDGKLPLLLGGEHLVTLGTLRAVVEKYPDLALIQLDAHCDLREDYIGNPLSHATVIRRSFEILKPNSIYQLGIRSGTKDEFAFAAENTYMQKFDLDGFEAVVQKLKDRPVYFTLDLDVLDSSVLPGTGTPEAGGIGFNELVGAIKQLSQLNIVGCDICELSPPYDSSGISTAVACKVLRELLLSLCKNERKK